LLALLIVTGAVTLWSINVHNYAHYFYLQNRHFKTLFSMDGLEQMMGWWRCRTQDKVM